MPITSFYAGLLGLGLFWISVETIKARWREKVSLGVGDQGQIQHIVAAHLNFISYVPFFLILFYLLEINQFSPWLLHPLALVFLFGRLLHFLTMKDREQTFKKRKLGMQLTLWPLIVASLLNIFQTIRSLLLIL